MNKRSLLSLSLPALALFGSACSDDAVPYVGEVTETTGSTATTDAPESTAPVTVEVTEEPVDSETTQTTVDVELDESTKPVTVITTTADTVTDEVIVPTVVKPTKESDDTQTDDESSSSSSHGGGGGGSSSSDDIKRSCDDLVVTKIYAEPVKITDATEATPGEVTPGETDETFTIVEDGLVKKVTVTLNVTNPNADQLEVVVYAPGESEGVALVLKALPGADPVLVPVPDQEPVALTYETPDLKDKSTKGEWRVVVIDSDADNATPTINSWELKVEWDGDVDADGVCADTDNCLSGFNPKQEDADEDGIGDKCDDCKDDAGNDADDDGVCANEDNCPDVANADGQDADADADGRGDACDTCDTTEGSGKTDTDGDDICDAVDTCPDDAVNDPDNDGVCADDDNCPDVANPDQDDRDKDNVGDACDNCVGDGNTDQLDTDNDGRGDVCDTCKTDEDGNTDTDNDDLCDGDDSCPEDSQNDIDGDGVCGDVDNCPENANSEQDDVDGDGVGDACDNCIETVNADQADVDADGIGNRCDSCAFDTDNDTDNDGVCGDVDNCPADTNSDQANNDSDEFGNVCDNCVDNANADQADGDKDGRGDACDTCKVDESGNADADNDDLCDGDDDPCDLDPNNDIDADLVCGDVDNCPDDWNPNQRDTDSDSEGDACEVPGCDTNVKESNSDGALDGDIGLVSPFAVNDVFLDLDIENVTHGTQITLTSPSGDTVVVKQRDDHEDGLGEQDLDYVGKPVIGFRGSENPIAGDWTIDVTYDINEEPTLVSWGLEVAPMCGNDCNDASAYAIEPLSGDDFGDSDVEPDDWAINDAESDETPGVTETFISRDGNLEFDDLSLDLKIRHQCTIDLTIELTSPGGITETIYEPTAQDIRDRAFMATNGTAAAFCPYYSMTLDGLDLTDAFSAEVAETAGDWTLTVTDNYPQYGYTAGGSRRDGGGGSLLEWNLNFTEDLTCEPAAQVEAEFPDKGAAN